MDKIAALLHEAKIEADENRSKDTRYFAASVVECVESLRQQLHDADESLKAVERALKDVDYRGTYADGVMYLKGQLAKTQDEFHFQACLTKDLLPYQERAIKSEQQLAAALAACEAKDTILRGITLYRAFNGDDWPATEATQALAIKPDASALKAHDDALIERCAGREECQGSAVCSGKDKERRMVMTNEEYVACGALLCPYCKSDDVEGDLPEIDSGLAVQESKCNTCGAEWLRLFHLP